MEDIRVNNKLQRVFVLRKTDDSIVYIPLTSLTYVDYKRLLDVEAQGGEMLTQMRKETFDNGRNALALYDNVIEVVRLTDKKKGVGKRVLKPGETAPTPEPEQPVAQTTEQPNPQTQKKAAPKKRGRPPASNKGAKQGENKEG